ncbi:MAG: 1-deoxy-D-xylulose-5-phosphate reductoisomerase [Clostridia bacterium]|nr:1-deoxy-D-xylulose-5-phosphate reductoisomerase [Clostridia bacterium]
MKRLTILGSTGSIGTQTLEVVRNNPSDFAVEGLSCSSNVDLLYKQILEFRPRFVAVSNENKAKELADKLSGTVVEDFISPKIFTGEDSNSEIAVAGDTDIVVAAMVGVAGLKPVVCAINAGKDIALANKETLVAGGEIVMPLVKEKNVKLLPVDSEHSAIWQCLWGEKHSDLDRILLTASGGPFRGYTVEQLKEVTLDKALKHPTWNMGGKITIDSATMMNKGLEVIEASHLFSIPVDNIDVVVHPQSIIHSMIRLKDGSVLAQMGKPSMIMPIMVALYYPERGNRFLEEFNPFDSRCSNITFEKCDTSVFTLLDLAYSMGRIGGLMPAVMNAANEEAVFAFLDKKISFYDIQKLVHDVCNNISDNVRSDENVSLDSIMEADKEARIITRQYMGRLNK